MARTRQRAIRLAKTADAEFIGALSRIRIEEGLPWRWRPARVRRSLADHRSTVIVAEDEGTLSGFAIMSFAETSAHLNLLAVSQQFSGTGVATAMLEWLRKSCQIAGIGRINLEVRANNHGAIHFYRRYGFKKLGVQHGYYEGREDALLMSCPLIDPEMEALRPE